MCSCLYASTCTFILIVTHKRRKTPLHYAAMRGNDEVVNALLEAGSKVDEKDEVNMFLKYEIELCTLHACSNVSSIQHENTKPSIDPICLAIAL